MNSVILTPMERGQITLPKKFRDKLGITSHTPLDVSLEEDKIVVKPLVRTFVDMKVKSGYVIKPKYSRKEKIKILEEISQYMKKYGPLWTEADDKAREKMREKERSINW